MMKWFVFLVLLLAFSSFVFGADEGLVQKGVIAEEGEAGVQERGSELLFFVVLFFVVYVVVRSKGRLW